MDNYVLNAALKGILEGLTEFLPISSTGHLVLVRQWLPLAGDEANNKRLEDLVDITCQFPAVLAIVVLYWKRLWGSLREAAVRDEARRFWLGLALAFVPVGILGLLLKKTIETKLLFPTPVACALIVGGIILILVERRRDANALADAERVPLKTAVFIGCFQCFGLFPGTSRSGATIVGARLLGLTRGAAAEYSFFLAIPTMAAVFVYKFYKERNTIQWGHDGPLLLAAALTAFITACVVVTLFVRFLQRYSLAAFGWYRIALGILVLVLLAQGVIH